MIPDREVERAVARAYREAVPIRPLDTPGLMERLASTPAPRLSRGWFDFGVGPRGLTLSPALGLAAAVLLLMVGAWAGGRFVSRPAVSSLPAIAATGTSQVVEFVLVAPLAEHVTVVGDFNGWDPAALPMRRAGKGGTWSTAMAIPEGRYTYCYVIDGRTWLPDPRAPLAPDDGFGLRNSVLLVRSGRSS